MHRLILFVSLLLILISGCATRSPESPAARSSSPFVEALKDARSAGAASDAATRATEEAIKAVKP